MAGNWYIGGIQAVYNGLDAWVSEAHTVSLVQGTSIVGGNQRSWSTLADFLAAGNTLVPDAGPAAIPAGKTAYWDSASDTYRFTFPSGQINMGTPAAGIDYCGALILGPLNALWAYVRVTGQTKGAPILFGSDSQTNILLTLDPVTFPNSDTGAGFTDRIFDNTAASWSGGTDTYEFALMAAGSFNKDWSDMNQASGGATFCTNCGFNGSANPSFSSSINPAPSMLTSDSKWPYQFKTGSLPSGLKWDKTFLQTGEIATGILGYINRGTAADSPIFMYNDITNTTLNSASDLIWDSFDTGSQTMLQVNCVGN